MKISKEEKIFFVLGLIGILAGGFKPIAATAGCLLLIVGGIIHWGKEKKERDLTP